MTGNEITCSPGSHVPKAPLMPHMMEGKHNHSDIAKLPQFPRLVQDVGLLNSRINTAAEDNVKTRWRREVEKAIEDADYKNFLIRKKFEGSPDGPVGLVEPVIPPEPQPPYYTGDSWNSFVLHDLNGVSTLTVGLVTSFNSRALESQEAKQLLKNGDAVAKIFENTKSTLHAKIKGMDTFISNFNESIDAIIAKEGEKLKDYIPLLMNAKKQTKIWSIVSRSAFMLNGIKDGDYAEVGKWFHELERTKIKIGDIFVVAAKNSEAIECPPELAQQEVDGVTGIMLFNLAKNAVVYKKSTVSASELDGEFTIENDAKFPIDSSHLFEPMRPGKDGHTGYGLFTVRNIYGRLAGKDVVCESTSTGIDEKDKKHSVKFSIKKSLPISSESPLPQPAQ